MLPLTPATLTEPLVERVVGLYQQAEAELISAMADRLARGLDTALWHERQLTELVRYREHAVRVLEKLRAARHQVINESVSQAGFRGQAIAVGDLQPTLAEMTVGARSVDVFAVTALAAELNQSFNISDSVILRSADDIYRKTLSADLGNVLLGTMTREQAADRMLRKLAADGLTAFIDRSGRRWEMRSYVEAATRGALTNAAIAGHTASLTEHGFDLIVVSDVPQECSRCRPCEGRVYSIGGRSDEYPSFASARSAGLFHPGCRHSVTAFLPGRTRSFGDTADPQGDKDRQKLRYYERQVRAAKREELAALTDEGRRRARARVKAYQAKIRHHVATTSAKRQPKREQLHPVEREHATNVGAWLKAEKARKAQPKPTGIAALPRKKAPGTLADDRAATNPKYHEGNEYKINCQRVVQAMEMRRRGYDVQAAPNYGAPRTPNIRPHSRQGLSYSDYWRDADGNRREIERGSASSARVFMSEQEVGARGWLRCEWKSFNGAHIWSWEVVADAAGKPYVKIYDAQPNIDNVGYYFDDAKPGTLGWIRVDDLEPTEKITDLLVPVTEEP